MAELWFKIMQIGYAWSSNHIQELCLTSRKMFVYLVVKSTKTCRGKWNCQRSVNDENHGLWKLTSGTDNFVTVLECDEIEPFFCRSFFSESPVWKESGMLCHLAQVEEWFKHSISLRWSSEALICTYIAPKRIWQAQTCWGGYSGLLSPLAGLRGLLLWKGRGGRIKKGRGRQEGEIR